MNIKKVKFKKNFQWNLNEGSIWWGAGKGINCLNFSFSTEELRNKFIEKIKADKEYINCCDDEKSYEMEYYNDVGKSVLDIGVGKCIVYSINFFYKEIN